MPEKHADEGENEMKPETSQDDDRVTQLRNDPAFRESVRLGVQAVKEGRVTPWSEVEKELFPQ